MVWAVTAAFNLAMVVLWIAGLDCQWYRLLAWMIAIFIIITVSSINARCVWPKFFLGLPGNSLASSSVSLWGLCCLVTVVPGKNVLSL